MRKLQITHFNEMLLHPYCVQSRSCVCKDKHTLMCTDACMNAQTYTNKYTENAGNSIKDVKHKSQSKKRRKDERASAQHCQLLPRLMMSSVKNFLIISFSSCKRKHLLVVTMGQNSVLASSSSLSQPEILTSVSCGVVGVVNMVFLKAQSSVICFKECAINYFGIHIKKEQQLQ